MFKTKFKSLVSILLVSIFLCTSSLATTEELTTDNNSEVAPISADVNTDGAQSTEPTPRSNSEEQSTESNSESVSNDSNWVKEDLYITGQDITVNQIVDGNTFVIGDKVTVSGEIGGDLFVMANEVTISSAQQGGYVYSNIFALANKLTIEGIVYDVYAVCDTFNLSPSGYIYRDIKVTASEINLEGFIRRAAYMSADNINFKYKPDSPLIVQSDVHANFKSMNFIPTTEGTAEDNSDIKVIGGNLNYSANSQNDDFAKYASGETTYSKALLSDYSESNSAVNYFISFVSIAILTLLVVLLLNKITPNFVKRTDALLTKKTLPILGIGLLGFIVAPIVMLIILLLLFEFTLPSISALIFAYGLLVSISTPILAIALGNIICSKLNINKNSTANIIKALLGAVIYLVGQLLYLLPVVGVLYMLIVNVLAFGIVLYNIFNSNKTIEKKSKKETKIKKENNNESND